MSDVFISYSRLDREFVGQLREALAAQKQDVWIDWESIPPSQAWWNEIQKGIAGANNFVVVISPNAMASPICQLEIEYARKIGKRIIPVLHLDYDRDEAVREIASRLANPEQDATRALWAARQPHGVIDANEGELKHINYFFFRPEDDFDARFAELFEIIRTDYAHKEKHTTLDLRAVEWDRRGRDASFLLLDNELAEAQEWLGESPGKIPEPTLLQREFIAESEKRTRQLKNIRRASVIGSAVAIIAMIFAVGASLLGVRAVERVNDANATLTPIPATLTQAAVVQQDIQDEQQIALKFAEALLGRSTDSAEIVATLDASAAEYSEHPSLYVYRGLVHASLGEYEAAITEYDQAIALDPNYLIAYNTRGGAYMNSGNYESGIANFSRMIELDRESALGFNNRATGYYELGDYARAIQDYDQAIRLDSGFVVAYLGRGNAYTKLRDYERALADFDRALEIDPNSGYAAASRGNTHHDLEDFESAIADYREYERLTGSLEPFMEERIAEMEAALAENGN